jgi:hypothetical protein
VAIESHPGEGTAVSVTIPTSAVGTDEAKADRTEGAPIRLRVQLLAEPDPRGARPDLVRPHPFGEPAA